MPIPSSKRRADLPPSLREVPSADGGGSKFKEVQT